MLDEVIEAEPTGDSLDSPSLLIDTIKKMQALLEKCDAAGDGSYGKIWQLAVAVLNLEKLKDII